jgi:GTP-binding protein
VLALVGRPNVGKSTLFNRLTRSRHALVAPIPGVTRDRKEQVVRFEAFRFRLVDTGGMSFSREVAFSEEIAAQVHQAIAEADLVWLVLDAAQGLNPYDGELFRALRKLGKPVIVVANKADSPGRRAGSAEFYALGAETVYPVSALHGSGLREALEGSAQRVPALLTAAGTPTTGEQPVRVAFIGRPNAGKSSLINRLLGSARQIVSEVAGTTREAVELPFRVFDQDYVLVDTAGIRRRARTKEYIEKISVLNALTAMEHADVVVLVLDANEGAAEQDARIAGYVLEKGRGLVVAMNKWDLLAVGGRQPKDVEADIAHALRFADFAPRVRLSAVTGDGMERLFKEVRMVAREFAREIQTADLNRVVQIVTRQTPPPAKGHSASKIHYGTQTGTRPPVFRFFANHPERIPDAYTRYMEHQLRYHFGFRGVPVGVQWRGRDAPLAGPSEEAGSKPARHAHAYQKPRPHNPGAKKTGPRKSAAQKAGGGKSGPRKAAPHKSRPRKLGAGKADSRRAEGRGGGKRRGRG